MSGHSRTSSWSNRRRFDGSPVVWLGRERGVMSCHVIVLDSNGLTSIYGFESRKGKCSTAGLVDSQFGLDSNNLPCEEARDC